METESSKVNVAQPVSMPTRTKQSPPKYGPTQLLHLSNELLHNVFIHIPFEPNQLCKLMLVNGQIREYITNNKAQICNDIAELQFTEQALAYDFSKNKVEGGEACGVWSQKCLIDLAKSDSHVNTVFQKMRPMTELGAGDHLTPSMLLTCLHLFEGLHRFKANTDDELESTLFSTMLRSVLPWLRLTSLELQDTLRKHLIVLGAGAPVEFFGTPGVELTCENVMVKYGLGPVVKMLDLTKAEYPEKGELAQAEFISEAWKIGKTENMMWSWALRNVPDFQTPVSAARPDQTTASATWGSVATASLVMKFFSSEILGLDQEEPMKEGFAGLMERCGAFPARIEITDQEQEQSPPCGLADVLRETGSMHQALMYNWAEFAGRGVRDGLTKSDKRVDGGLELLRAALGPLLLANDVRCMGLDSLAAQVADLPPYSVFFAMREDWNTKLDEIEKKLAEGSVSS